MSFYSLPDITGQNPDYLQPNFLAVVFKNPQVIQFENSPVFEDSIKIVMTDKLGTALVKGVDWAVASTDVDDMAISQAKLEDANFSKSLLKSITIISAKALNQRIAITFQEFYLTQPGRTFDDGRPFELTPDLTKNMLTDLASIKQQIANSSSPVALNNKTPKLLPFDVNKELDSNIVDDEIITVNTTTGVRVLRLSQGAFFADDLTIEYNGKLLDKSKDYLPFNVSPLTKQSTSKGGIFNNIVLIGNITGEVKVTYHAVGGDVQPDDISALYATMTSIHDFLRSNSFVTADALARTIPFRAVFARMTKLENDMRILLNDAPTYGDATAGQTVVRPIASPDANFHWWTIANLYKVQGSNDIVTADQFRGRVSFPGAKTAVSFVVDFNLDQDRNPVSITTESLVFDPTYVLFESTSPVAPVYPMIRVCWNKTAQAFSGASIQIGIPLTALSERMVVEDMSSNESCWILDKTGQFIKGNTTVSPTSPRDDGFVLPDGSSTWSNASASSFKRVYVPTFDKGYLVYSGSVVSLATVETASSTKSSFPVSLPNYFPLDNISEIIVTMASPDGSTVYDVRLPTPRLRLGVKAGRSDFVALSGETIVMTAALNSNTQGNVELAINVQSRQAHSSPLTDVIRYVRVKV